MSLFPEKGMPEEEIREELEKLYQRAPRYTSEIFRRYSTNPHPIAIEAIKKFLEINPNNIGTHTRVNPENLGVIARIEKEVILMLGELMGSTDIDGYITQGGTEGNIMGLWVGRNMLRVHKNSERKICLLKTTLTHYSIDKAADILDIPEIIDVPLNKDYGMDSQKLYEILENKSKEGFKEFLIALTLGYNTTGTIDPVDEIDAAVKKAEEKLDIKTYIHLDAAIGGLVYPFASDKPLDFRYQSIQSISLDMHKTGFVPHTAGAFLCRKGLQQWVESPASYLRYMKDDTLSGSRPGTSAVAAWSTLKTLGKGGFTKIIREELVIKNYFLDLIYKKKFAALPSTIHSLAIPIVAIDLQKELPNSMVKMYKIYPFKLKISGEEKLLYSIIFMPHLTKKAIYKFTEDVF